jgi:hypothetical protein
VAVRVARHALDRQGMPAEYAGLLTVSSVPEFEYPRILAADSQKKPPIGRENGVGKAQGRRFSLEIEKTKHQRHTAGRKSPVQMSLVRVPQDEQLMSVRTKSQIAGVLAC